MASDCRPDTVDTTFEAVGPDVGLQTFECRGKRLDAQNSTERASIGRPNGKCAHVCAKIDDCSRISRHMVLIGEEYMLNGREIIPVL